MWFELHCGTDYWCLPGLCQGALSLWCTAGGEDGKPNRKHNIFKSLTSWLKWCWSTRLDVFLVESKQWPIWIPNRRNTDPFRYPSINGGSCTLTHLDTEDFENPPEWILQLQKWTHFGRHICTDHHNMRADCIPVSMSPVNVGKEHIYFTSLSSSTSVSPPWRAWRRLARIKSWIQWSEGGVLVDIWNDSFVISILATNPYFVQIRPLYFDVHMAERTKIWICHHAISWWINRDKGNL